MTDAENPCEDDSQAAAAESPKPAPKSIPQSDSNPYDEGTEEYYRWNREHDAKRVDLDSILSKARFRQSSEPKRPNLTADLINPGRVPERINDEVRYCDKCHKGKRPWRGKPVCKHAKNEEGDCACQDCALKKNLCPSCGKNHDK